MAGLRASVRAYLYLLGYPVAHSISPYIYNKVFRELGVDAEYGLMEVADSELSKVINRLRDPMIKGFNVTIPHKINVARLVDRLSSAVADIGAVNTVVNKSGVLTGFNTDWKGFLAPLVRLSSRKSFSKTVIIGAGGAAHAVVYGLKNMVDHMAIFSLSGRTAEALALKAEEWGVPRASGYRVSPSRLLTETTDADLVVNASPMGMEPHQDVDVSHISPPSGAVVYDLVYKPLETALLSSARRRGCVAIDGLWMLAQQASENLRLWFGLEVGAEKLRRYGLEVLMR